MNDLLKKPMIAEGYAATLAGFDLRHPAVKATDAFFPDGVGDLKPVPGDHFLILTSDEVADDTSTTRTVEVDGASVVSTIDTVGDQDFFRVELTAGHTYDIGQYLVMGGPSGVPLNDAYVELYGPDGQLITQADGGGPDTPSGLDALLTFTPKTSGTYFINARAFDQEALNGTTGDGVGDYQLFVDDVTGRPSYIPYYDVESPLHSIDWGAQVDRTSRNPDGEEGPRITGNDFTGVGGNPFGIEGKNVITVYFAKAGDVFVSEDPTSPGTTENMIAIGMQDWEKAAFYNAFELYSQVADLVFVEVDSRAEADFKIVTYKGTPGAGASLLGRMSPPNEQNEGQAEFNAGDVRWTQEGLQPGGFYFPTLLHELGHGLGMAHPHDNGGRSSIMRGADGGTAGIGGGLGDFDLSQQVHTVMSYNDGWATSPYGQARSGGLTGLEVDHFGWVASLSPLDMAVIQDKYGVNEDTRVGDDVYSLKDVNAAGTAYTAIWDSGGIDTIAYDGARDASIDLRPATLQYEEGGGGRVSYAWGIYGGFTIANAVTIENARSGAGNDTLTGNDAGNLLDGGAGNDVLIGGAGADRLVGGLGQDRLDGGAGADLFVFAAGDSAVGLSRDTIVGFDQGSDRIDLTGAGATQFIGGALFSGEAGQVRAVVTAGSTIVELDGNGDGLADFQLELDGAFNLELGDFAGLADANGASMADDVLAGTALADVLFGYGGDDSINGGGGNDRLIGGGGADSMSGGSGADRFVYEAASDSGVAASDVITDFRSRSDQIDLGALDANISTAADDAFAFIGKSAFSGSAGELRYQSGTYGTLIQADLDGDAVADLQIRLDDRMSLVVADFVL
ncbi:M10 family metallopeptidase C-terminal domain-containing protein [Sphingomonas parva]|nr:M10 family metallopeptidase C-terminal domain-containing protein [Sphingomonas parva]